MSSTTSAPAPGVLFEEWLSFRTVDLSEDELAQCEVLEVPDEEMLAGVATLPASMALGVLEGIDVGSVEDPLLVLEFLRAAERIAR